MNNKNCIWKEVSFYFDNIPQEFSYFKLNYPIWKWTEGIADFIKQFFNLSNQPAVFDSVKPFIERDGIYFSKNIKLKNSVLIPELEIYLGNNIFIEAGTTIQAKTIILDSCKIRQSAYLRENTVIGNSCVIGHGTEIKNSLLFSNNEIGHFNYIGDSVIGSYCNLGAGSILCNLAFRTLQQKKNHLFPEMSLILSEKEQIKANKKGVVLGDGSEIGCNSVVGPFSFLGQNCQVYPNVYVSKGIYSPKSVFKTSQDYKNFNIAGK